MDQGRTRSETPTESLQWTVGEPDVYAWLRQLVVRELVLRPGGVLTGTATKAATALGVHPETSPDKLDR